MWGLSPFIWLIIVVVITVVCIVLVIWQPIKQSGYGTDIAKLERAANVDSSQEENTAEEGSEEGSE